MSRFASGVAVVSAQWQGSLHAMTATALCSVSLEPPLVLTCVGRRSRFHPALLGSGAWGVSVLAREQDHLARHFSDRTRDLTTQFDAVPHRRGEHTGAPLVEGALAWLECRTVAVHDGGDHSIVIGQVLDASASTAAELPLTYYRGSYG